VERGSSKLPTSHSLTAQTYQGGVDWAGVLYQCAVGSTAKVVPNSANVTLRGSKVR